MDKKLSEILAAIAGVLAAVHEVSARIAALDKRVADVESGTVAAKFSGTARRGIQT